MLTNHKIFTTLFNHRLHTRTFSFAKSAINFLNSPLSYLSLKRNFDGENVSKILQIKMFEAIVRFGKRT